MNTLPIYAFYNASGVRRYADNDDFIHTGTWSSTGTYFASPLQAAQYGDMLYMCITDNINKVPTAPLNRFHPIRYWSPMVIVVAAGSVSSGALAEQAYTIAGQAYALAVAGTNAAAAAGSLAFDAYALAQNGTNAAAGAAVVAGEAYALAVTGTDAAAGAEALAAEAYALATVGTDAAAGAQALAAEAYALAQAGTTSTGSIPYSTNVSGTIGYSFSGSAFQTTMVTGDLAVATRDFQNGSKIEVVLMPDGNLHNLTYVGSPVVWFGTTPPVSLSDKIVTYDLTCLDTSPVILGNAAVAISPTVAKIGNSFLFDAATYDEFTGSTLSVFPTEITISMWVKTAFFTLPGPPGPPTTQALAHRTSGDPDQACDYALSVSNVIHAFAWPGATLTLDGDTVLANNTWYHVAMTCKQSVNFNFGFLSLYLNGVSDAISAIMGTAPAEGTDWWIGKACADLDGRGATTGGNFRGRLAEVAIWNKQLNGLQIAALAVPVRGTPATIEPASLVMYLPMSGLPDGQTVNFDWPEQVGGLTQNRTGSPTSTQVVWP